MSAPSSSIDLAFQSLHACLLKRRLEQLDLRLRFEIVLLAGIVGGFLFWRARIPFDGLARAHGPLAVAAALATILAVLALATGGWITARHARQLREALPGPAWLALPVASGSLIEHLAWEARLHRGWALALAPGWLVAAWGLVPWWAIAGITAAFLAALWGAGRLATAVARHSVVGKAVSHRTRDPRAATAPPSSTRADRSAAQHGAEPMHAAPLHAPHAPDPVLAVLGEARTAVQRARVRPAAWRRLPRWLALWLRDVQLAMRSSPARARLVAPLLLAFLSGAVWLLPVSPPLARVLAFAAALTASAALAEFLIALAGLDPLPVLHGLPLDARSVWLGRALWAALGTLVLCGLQLVCARALAPEAIGVLVVWLACATFAIGLLGVHYGMTLAAHPSIAQRFLVLTLAISMAASVMIPLLGWIVLLTAVLHSARRVPRWSRLEAER